VATAAGIYDVIPAGEFQPSSIAPPDLINDFDIWRKIVREFSEELLGAPEYDGCPWTPNRVDRSDPDPARTPLSVTPMVL